MIIENKLEGKEEREREVNIREDCGMRENLEREEIGNGDRLKYFLGFMLLFDNRKQTEDEM